MNLLTTSLVLTSVLLLSACEKTEKLASDTTEIQTIEQDISIDVTAGADGQRMIVTVNGEEQEFDLSELEGSIDIEIIGIENIDGELLIAVMHPLHDDEEFEHWVVDLDDDDSEHAYHVIVNGKEMDGPPEDMMSHVMSMIANGEDTDVDISYGWSKDQMPNGMQEHMKKMMGGKGGPPHGMQEHMMQMMGGNPHEMEHGHQGEWRHERDRDITEEHQFMEELDLLGEVSQYLNESDAVAMMGIHMIRDNLEGDIRMEALDAIIEEAGSGSAVRNAAIIVAIQTLQQYGDTEAAADLMVELVLSN